MVLDDVLISVSFVRLVFGILVHLGESMFGTFRDLELFDARSLWIQPFENDGLFGNSLDVQTPGSFSKQFDGRQSSIAADDQLFSLPGLDANSSKIFKKIRSRNRLPGLEMVS